MKEAKLSLTREYTDSEASHDFRYIETLQPTTGGHTLDNLTHSLAAQAAHTFATGYNAALEDVYGGRYDLDGRASIVEVWRIGEANGDAY